MASYNYHANHHDNNIHHHDHNALHHHQVHHPTLLLMNPNFPAATAAFPDSHAPQPTPSHNILLLNSAATLHHHHHDSGVTLYGHPQMEAARDLTRRQQGLSLRLPEAGGDADVAAAGGGGVGSVLGSRYLRAAQELLEEVVRVGDDVAVFKANESPKKSGGELTEEGNGGGGGQLSSAERQELQMKKAKLVTMLDEAEQRYRQYHHQMQVVITSFEQAAGVGSAKTYTALALKTISKQFRCLKDAIQSQIRAATKGLGKEEAGGGGGNKIEGSRLKYIDHQIRQQRALQQLGMIQNHNAWRPQRGLPERSVSVLRAWLFEHFLHPYPKDSDKIMLAKQTGLTRSQVSNWFINARVRLWKPMIEEMYTEEIKEHERNGSEDQKTSSKETSNQSNSTNDHLEKINNIAENQNQANDDQNPAVSSCTSSLIPIATSSPQPFKGNNNNNNTTLPQTQHGFGFALNGSFEMEGLTQGSPKRPRNDEIFIKFGNDHKQGRDNNNVYPIISGGMNFMGGGELGSYPTLGEMGRFETGEFPPPRFLPGNGISLSLGLPPSENQLNLSATNHTFLSPNPNIHSSAAAFECIDIQNRKGFAAQLLPDFVA